MSGGDRWRLAPSGFEAIDRLIAGPAFTPRNSSWEQSFVAAIREAFVYHRDHSPEFEGHARLAGFKAEQIKSLIDVEQIPWIFVQNFKEAELLSVKRDEVELILTSSGTRGAKTQLFLDHASLNRIEVAAYNVYRDLRILDQHDQCNYLMFTYDIEQAPDLGTAWTDVMIADMLPGGERVYLIRKKNGEFEFDLELALESYDRFARSGKPLRVLGFPAFMYHTFSEARARGLAHKLSPEAALCSWILTGGGWKNHQGQMIPKSEFANFVHDLTAIPTRNVRDLFGMSEHGVGYVDCEQGRLHVPAYAHAITRDPYSLKRLPDGEPGMLHLYTPLLRSYPSLSLLTTDEVRLNPAPCPCGRSGAGLEVMGRLGLKAHESCALRALETLK